MVTDLYASGDFEGLCGLWYQNCRKVGDAWTGSLTFEEGDVVYNSAAAWRGRYSIMVLSYNAADDDSTTVVAGQPLLSPAQLEEIAMSDAWFSPTP
ncbi:hypothetical protein [Nocardioides sp. InS609-2]|uniref:hypothetical protein n=1 Tax=Nocardioides sp. InS609-2 TaxID=2760705 RepID=UPI0020C087B4|nr:hypothetical protein [Nocardioides sp. InS609-2]